MAYVFKMQRVHVCAPVRVCVGECVWAGCCKKVSLLCVCVCGLFDIWQTGVIIRLFLYLEDLWRKCACGRVCGADGPACGTLICVFSSSKL